MTSHKDKSDQEINELCAALLGYKMFYGWYKDDVRVHDEDYFNFCKDANQIQTYLMPVMRAKGLYIYTWDDANDFFIKICRLKDRSEFPKDMDNFEFAALPAKYGEERLSGGSTTDHTQINKTTVAAILEAMDQIGENSD